MCLIRISRYFNLLHYNKLHSYIIATPVVTLFVLSVTKKHRFPQIAFFVLFELDARSPRQMRQGLL